MIDGDRRQMSGGQLHRVMKAGRAVWLDITRNHRAEGELAGERTYSARTQECVKSCQERSTNYLTGPTSLEMLKSITHTTPGRGVVGVRRGYANGECLWA